MAATKASATKSAENDKSETASGEAGKKSYLANWQISHDGDDYAAGAELTLTDKQSAALVECGAISPKNGDTEETNG